MCSSIFGSAPLVLYSGRKVYDYTYLLFPYCMNGTLLDLLVKADKKKIRFSKELQLYLCASLIRAVAYLHRTDRKAHCDVKPNNIIIKDDFALALIDCGQAIDINTLCTELTGTLNYRAPEVKDTYEGYDPAKADIFSLGATLFAILM